jgi:hypothetical protein
MVSLDNIIQNQAEDGNKSVWFILIQPPDTFITKIEKY